MLNNGAGRGHHQHFVAFKARTDNIGAVQDRHVLNRHIVQVGIFDADINGFNQRMAVGERGFMIFRLLPDVDPKQHAHQPHRKQNAANTKRISHGVAHAHLVDDIRRNTQIAKNLLARPERRRVGDGTGENPQHHRKRDSEEFVQNSGDQPAHHHNPERKEVQPQSGDTQRGKKARPHLNTDGIHKEDQAELLDEVQHVRTECQPKLVSKVPDKNAAKQHPTNPKSDATDFDITDPQPHHRDQGHHADG